jgi:NAD(P)-dependent dehydrogenase (short-subunit alcohol dehydrogenase family)
MMGRLADKVAVIFGASANNGGTIAHFMAREGARICLSDYVPDTGSTSQGFLASRGYDAIAVPADASKEDEVRAVFEACLTRFGRVDILVNMAGKQIRFDVMEIALEDWNRQITAYLTSAMLTTKQAARAMAARDVKGSIVHIASDAAHQGEAGNSGYSAAKAAVVNFSRAAAAELGHLGIRVNTISPTYIEHNIWKYGIDEPRARFNATPDDFLRGIPLARFCRASDVAHAAVFLASEESSFITGCDIPLDGGARAKYWAWTPGNYSNTTCDQYAASAKPQRYGEPSGGA